MTNQNKKLAKALAVSMYAVGFVTQLVFSNIAEAENFGAGGTGQWLSDAQIESFSAKNSNTKFGWSPSNDENDEYVVTSNISGDNCVMINDYRFKVVKTETPSSGDYAGKQILTLWSYNSTETGATKSFATDSKYEADGDWSDSNAITAAEAYNNSDLKTAMDVLLTYDESGNPNGGELYDSKLTYVKYTSTTDSNVTDAYVWAPSKTEVESTAWGDGTTALTDAQRAVGSFSWLRSPYPAYGVGAYYVSFGGGIGYIYVDFVDDYVLTNPTVRPALQILNQISYVFTTNVTIPTNEVFKADDSAGTNYASYALNSTATIVPTFTPATDGVSLDGTKIGVTVTDSTSADYVTKGLLTEEKDSAKNDTWANLNGPSVVSTKGISYIAHVDSNNELDMVNVDAGISYTLKVFGLKTADTTVTELADNAVNGLSIGSDGKIHIQVSGIVNAGMPVTASNGAVVDFGGGTLTAKLDFKSGGNLVVNNQMNFGTNGVVEQASGSNITVAASLIEADNNDPIKAMFTGVDNAANLDVDTGNLTITGSVADGKYYVLVAGMAVNSGTVSDATLWKMDNISFPDILMADYEIKYDTNTADNPGSIALHVTNATTKEEGNTSGLAAVQQGNITVAKEISDEVVNRLSFVQRPSLLQKMQAKVRDVANTNKDDYKVETVEQGKANEVMPVQFAEKDKYDKEVWASHIRTKETTEGMKLGAGVEGNNTAQYNGAVVGVDFYSSKKAVTGLALGYITGDIDSYSGNTFTRNKSKYYGVSFYDRVTNGNTALIYDIGYIRGDNNISQFYNKEITADVKTDTYTAGVRYEAEFGTKESRVVPFASFRYMRQNNKDYTNSHNTRFETKNQNLYIPKVGIAWTGDFAMPQCEWTWRPSVEAGYVWNLGDRSAESMVYAGTLVSPLDYDVVDKSSYYAKAGMEFMTKNFTAGVFYRYLKGNAVRNNKWNINMSWAF